VVLIDDPYVRVIVVDLLSEEGYAVIASAHPRRHLRDARRMNEATHSDLVLLDLWLVGPNTIGEARKRMGQVPIVGFGDPFDRTLPLDGLEARVPMPFEIEQVLDTVERCRRPHLGEQPGRAGHEAWAQRPGSPSLLLAVA
jgi:DNA-binding response OmpR family regulator